jgi:hypothetical protein
MIGLLTIHLQRPERTPVLPLGKFFQKFASGAGGFRRLALPLHLDDC